MANVQWIKIAVDIFDNRKIRQIESMPEGESVLLIWLKLICLAGSVNDGGYIYFTKEIPYTEEMLATHFNKPLATIRLALKTFQSFRMIEIIDNIIQLSNWEKYQDTNRLAEIREKNRLRKQAQREREKEEKLLMSRDSHVTDCDNHATEREGERDKDISSDISKDISSSKLHQKNSNCPYQDVVDKFNEICVSYPKVIKCTAKRIKAIKARWTEYNQNFDTFVELFEKAEASPFLKGNNKNKWSATFDWLIESANMIKVLEGNFDSKGGEKLASEKPSFSEFRKLV